MAPGRSYHYYWKIIFLKVKVSNKGGTWLMLQVTDAAMKQIKEELDEMDVDTSNPFIRVYMALG